MRFELLAYVFMDNHYHLIIRTIDAPLSKAMHRINNSYGKFYNKTKKKTGHIFENRYKAIIVEDNRYLLALLRYIHYNPVSAKICKKITDYNWSSDSYYRNNKNSALIDINFILGIFSSDRAAAITAYCEFMDSANDENMLEIDENALVVEAPQLNLFQELSESSNNPIKGSEIRMPLADILKGVCPDESIIQLIIGRSRKRGLSEYKRQYIKQALDNDYTMREIGSYIGISDAAVAQLKG